MNKALIEATALRHINHVLGGGKIEDSTVEAKRAWPGVDKAKQLAGLANAALGHPVMLLIGLCEATHTVVPIDDKVDLATWWPQVKSKFLYGAVPRLTDLTVHTNHGAVVCLYFETDQPPYMVAGTGWVNGGVPWRDGTDTRSATRADLLLMLSQTVSVPVLELIKPEAILYEHQPRTFQNIVPQPTPAPQPEPGPPSYNFGIRGGLFIDAEPDKHVVFPEHRWSVVAHIQGVEPIRFTEIQFTSARQHANQWVRMNSGEPRPIPPDKSVDPFGVTDRPVGLVVRGPDSVTFHGSVEIDAVDASRVRWADTVEIEMHFPIGAGDRAARIVTKLAMTAHPPTRESAVARWILPEVVEQGRSAYEGERRC
ncbi:hypothetical protein [Nocardia takedensis]|uniref:hypothetical protein n=1 Tax=Nocardia takedensis TaxID=259390 RepID=UPI000594CC6B|nr:hypothetical protein [Nocardia takedensis]